MHLIRRGGFKKAGWNANLLFVYDETIIGGELLNILILNDDGIAADGLKTLARHLAQRHCVTVAAPMHQQSGTSHALTIGSAIEVRADETFDAENNITAWAINGTPADCAKLYLDAIAGEMPDVVLSGINHGSNLGTDVIYSGTVGAAFEGLFHGIPSFSLSLIEGSRISFTQAAGYFEPFMQKIMEQEKKPFLLNINFPKELAGNTPQFIFCRQGGRDYINAFERIEEYGRIHYRVSGEVSDTDKGMGTDIYAVEHGFISVTPLGIDTTDYCLLEHFSAVN